jgi:glucose/arabinose dehydrogenase
VREAYEPGLAAWTVFLDQNQNGVLDATEVSTVTNADGSYGFTGLAPGAYTVAQVLQPGWQSMASSPIQTSSSQTVVLNPDTTAVGIDFGDRALFPTIALTPALTGLTNPVFVTSANDGSDRLFVVEQPGRIRIAQNGTLVTTPFLDIRDRVLTGGEQGLLSIAFPPGYTEKQHFYVYYTNRAGNLVISRYRLTTDPNLADPNSEQIILTINHPTYTNHNGGQLAFGPDGYLYIGTGDGGGGGDPNNNAQNPASLLGKILRIDVESPATVTYTIPTTNPFLTTADPTDQYRDEIWALGLRNPWRFSFDRFAGDLYIADVGQNAYEEVNFQPASSSGGQNYGWRILEGSSPYLSNGNDTAGLVLPVTEYDRSQGASITGGYVYRGTTIPQLQGTYLYGDFVNGRIWGLRPNQTGWETQLLLDSPYGISSFGEDGQGNLYVADYFGGAVYQVTV